MARGLYAARALRKVTPQRQHKQQQQQQQHDVAGPRDDQVTANVVHSEHHALDRRKQEHLFQQGRHVLDVGDRDRSARITPTDCAANVPPILTLREVVAQEVQRVPAPLSLYVMASLIVVA